MFQDERITLFEEYCALVRPGSKPGRYDKYAYYINIYLPRFIENGFTLKVVKNGKYEEITVKLE
jgi:hypothetical protein